MTGTIDPGTFRDALSAVPWIADVFVFDEVGSTNDEALRLAAEGAPSGTIVVADVQTAGRGRLGRSWWSEPGTTLTTSWVLRPDQATERWSRLTLACGVAVATALSSHTGLEVVLKWPNDVMSSERKLGGILAEARPPEALVIGFGLNLSCAIPEEIAETAASVSGLGGLVPDRAGLLAAIAREFDALDDSFLVRYRSLCSTLGKRVRIERPGAAPLEGVALDVDESGALIVRTEAADVRVGAGDVTHVRAV